MTQLLLATTSADKIREMRTLLQDVPLTVRGLRDYPPVPEPEETGATFSENARLKALYYSAALVTGAPVDQGHTLTVAEDSGLVVDALGGEPGVYSARFLRPDATYPERFAAIEARLAATAGAPRTARFVCALAVVAGAEVVFEAQGTVEGEIAPARKGHQGFGYDPIFYYPPYAATLAEVSTEAKLQISHRGAAFRAFMNWLRERV